MKRFTVALACASALGVAGASARAQSPETAPARAAPSVTGEQYAVRQRDLQHRVDELRSELSASHMHLEILTESLLGEPIGGARVAIRHENAMGPLYRLERTAFTLDGALLNAQGSRTTATSEQLYNGSLAPGDHTLTIDLEYRGQGLGLFPYLEGYQIHLRSMQSFTVRPGRGIELRIVGFEQGGAATSLEQRPGVRVLTRDVPLRDLADQ